MTLSNTPSNTLVNNLRAHTVGEAVESGTGGVDFGFGTYAVHPAETLNDVVLGRGSTGLSPVTASLQTVINRFHTCEDDGREERFFRVNYNSFVQVDSGDEGEQ